MSQKETSLRRKRNNTITISLRESVAIEFREKAYSLFGLGRVL
ncbi:MAG: hypothetical protein Q6362_002245 [Candidatus Wukongarchaeota archaeon]|nr:hypothetical protein [Candidatus Wukongarchaeota archaeon]MDO8128255.1 hypothetical protein [Candidatus Wukongarchaeota archaeon]